MKEQIYACCKELRLSTTFAENALSLSGATPQEYLLSVLRAEIDYRNTKRKKLHLKQAGFDNIKTFEGYDFNKIIIPNTTSMDGIKSLDFMERNENLILYGRNGAGKSHMATAIGVEACMQGKKVRFYKTATLVNELTDAKSEGSQLLFQVIADCYEKRSLILTTNIEFSKWNGIFYDDQLTAALIDRLVHHSHLIVFDRDSWRFEHSLMKDSATK